MWHTILFVAIVFFFAGASAKSQAEMIARHGRMSTYLITMAWEWLLTLYVLWGASRRKVTLREITGGRWSSPEDVLLDLATALGFWLVAASVLVALSYALGLTTAGSLDQAKKTLDPLIPRTREEVEAWVALSATAGFCEELIFRGYLQKQFRAATGSTLIAIVLQAVVFGCAHAYQGTRGMVLTGSYGAMFGILAAWRKSLRPGMLAHAAQDTFSGLAFRFIK